MTQVFTDIIDWAIARNIIDGATSRSQFVKLMAEFGELADGISKNNLDLIKDGIGDVAVVALIIGKQEHLTLPVVPKQSESIVGLNLRDMGMTRRKFAETFFADCSQLLGELSRFIELQYKNNLESVTRALFEKLSDLATLYGLSFIQCVEYSYEQIKDRKGIMFNGVFLRDTDPRYQETVAQIKEEQK